MQTSPLLASRIMNHLVAALCAAMLALPGCFVSLDAGVAMPVAGPVEKTPATTLGFAIGFAADFGVGLVALGTGLVTHQVTRDSGEVDEIANFGPIIRADATLWHDPSPLVKGANFGSVVRATGTVILGGCRKLDVDNAMRDGDGECKSPADAAIGDGFFVSVGALAGIRTDTGDTLSLSLSPYYARSKHPTESNVGIGGVRARISLSGVPKALSGLATLFSGYDYEENQRRMKIEWEKNQLRGGKKKVCKDDAGRIIDCK